MRQRFRGFRARSMATRSNAEGRPNLPPHGRRLVGWIAALAIVVGIAVGVGFLGSADRAPQVAAPAGATPTDAPGEGGRIRFGTALDPTTQEVADGAETTRFAEGDTFAYSHRPEEPPPTTVWVEVRRETDGGGEAVQEPAPHALAEDARVIAFAVPADALFRDFGTGAFQMRIYLEEDGPVAASGSFELVPADASPSPGEG